MLEPFIKIVLIVGVIMTAAAYFVLVERWIAAWVQMRRGPNRVGIPLTNVRLFGLGQPLADGLKFIFKEEYEPAHVDRKLYLLAPLMIMASALAIFAVIPFGHVIPPMRWLGQTESTPLIAAPSMDVGLIYVFALSSIGVYGVILGGWSSNNKYSFLGGLRSSAQLIAYELPLGLGILGIALAASSLRLDAIIEYQARTGVWFAFVQPLGLVVFVVSAFAEAARLPFDLPEAEQELIGGYHTEYSGMKLLLFLTAEFIHMITASFLIAIMFFGGWHLWGIETWGTTDLESPIGWWTALLRITILMVKIVGVILFFMLVRWTWPRFRFDQLMALAWKVMLPLGIVNLVAIAFVEEFGRDTTTGFRILYGWGILALAWIVVALAAPLIADNKART